MSDYQIGGRKWKNVRDHIFTVNGNIQDTLTCVKKKPVKIIVAYFTLCFDRLSLPITLKSGCKDDKFGVMVWY